MPESARMRAVQLPVIPTVAELIRNHPGTISLGQGVVGYGPPDAAIARIQDFLANPQNHKYRPTHGIPELVAALKAKLAEENGIALTEENCLFVTPGANMAFTNALLAIADPGDEIILLAPYYFNHDMAIAMADCRTVPVPLGPDYQISVEAIRAAITPRTRAVVTISPNNPTGAVYTEATMREVDVLCLAHGLYHICDETYEHFMYNGARHFSPATLPGSAPHTISIFSFSKAYGFASWRVGYMVFPAELRLAVEKAQDTLVICTPVISQWAALGALEAGEAFYRPRIAEIGRVREVVLDAFDRLPGGVTRSPAEGSFYCFLKVDTRLSAMELVERLVRDFGVAAIPGDTFGLEDGCYLRVSYGPLDTDTVAEGAGRLIRGLESIVGDAPT